MEVRISFDNITLTGSAVSWASEVMMSLQMQLEQAKVMLSKIPYDMSYVFNDGTFFQIAYSKNNYNGIASAKHCRLEFNPNKANVKLVKSLLRLFHTSRPKVTRYDVAIDYFNEDLSGVRVHNESRPKKRTSIHSQSGKLETLYIGSSASGKQLRWYDKRLEQFKRKNFLKAVEEIDLALEDETLIEDRKTELINIRDKLLENLEAKHQPWWRAEMQVRPGSDNFHIKHTLLHNPFDNLLFYKSVRDDIKDIRTRAMIYYLSQKPEEWATLSPPARRKYRELFSESVIPLIPQPKDIFEQKKDQLQASLAFWFESLESPLLATKEEFLQLVLL